MMMSGWTHDHDRLIDDILDEELPRYAHAIDRLAR
jgi:hypothetical protein